MFMGKYSHLSPEEFIRCMFKQTRDGMMELYYDQTVGEPEALRDPMSWKESDLEEFIQRYCDFAAKLTTFAKMHDILVDRKERERILSEEDRKIWDIYVEPLKPFEVEQSVIDELYFRGEFDQLTDEENDLLERHYDWCETQCLARLPKLNDSSYDLIISAQRFENIAYLNDLSLIKMEIGRELAYRMAIYYFYDKKNKPVSEMDMIIEKWEREKQAREDLTN